MRLVQQRKHGYIPEETRAAYKKRVDRIYVKEWCRRNGHRPPGLSERFSNGKRDAKMRGLTWSITKEQYATLNSKPCHYCGSKLPMWGHGLDRLDYRKGYLLTNMVPCCGPCNKLKGGIENKIRWVRHDCPRNVAKRILQAIHSNSLL